MMVMILAYDIAVTASTVQTAYYYLVLVYGALSIVCVCVCVCVTIFDVN